MKSKKLLRRVCLWGGLFPLPLYAHPGPEGESAAVHVLYHALQIGAPALLLGLVAIALLRYRRLRMRRGRSV